MTTQNDKERSQVPVLKETNSPKCGIVMPISEIDGCTSEHWSDVLEILREVIREAGFEPNLVSDADDIGVIQKRIVQNIYNNPIIICDVSGKNPNVMFELGLRLAFDKATIIIKDDKTDFSFDTSVIEHIGYPRDLRFNKMVEFKKSLTSKLKATFKKASTDLNYSTFLKSFGEFKVTKLNEQEVSSDEYIMDSINELKGEIRRMRMENQDKVHRRHRLRGEISPKDRELIIKNAILEYMKDNNIKTITTLKKNETEVLKYIVHERKEMPSYFDDPMEVRELASKLLQEL